MKVYKTNITEGMCPDWDKLDVAREFIANALDNEEEHKIEFHEGVLSITSFNTTLPPKVLTLGASTNREDSNAIGKHGDGLKASMAVGLREGLDIDIFNGGKLWTPFFEYDEDYGISILKVQEKEVSDNDHFTVNLEGYDEEDMEIIKERCLYLQSEGDIGNIIECEMGTVLFDKKGKLFVGGVWVTNTGLKYSYDFKPQYLHLNRDRKTVVNWDLKTNTARMLQLVETPEFISQLVVDNTSDTQYLQYIDITEEVKDSCFDLYEEKYKDKMLATSQSEKNTLISQGYSDIVVESDQFVSVVKESSGYKEKVFERNQQTPLDFVEELEDNKDLSREEAFSIIINKFKERGVKWQE